MRSRSPSAPAALHASFLATRRGRLTLILLCAVAFLAAIPVTAVNVALPAIQRDLHVSAQSLQWIPSGYLLTYGGFMLLGGRAADLAGRRRVLVTGTAVFAVSQLVAGLAPSAAVVIGARLAQGVGGALMLPAALSILTTTFGEGADRRKALGAWGAMIGLSSVGSVLGGLLVQAAGWRWVFLALPPLCLAVLAGVFWLIGPDHRRAELAHLDLPGAVLSTGGLLLLVYALVRAPVTGWGSAATVAELAGAAVLALAFVVGERRSKNPLLPLSLFRVPGVGAADLTALIGFAGFIAVFYFYTLYSQNVLGYSPVKSGLGFLPVAAGIATVARAAPRLISRTGTRPVLIAGTLVAAGGVYWLSRMPVHGSYFTDLFPGLVISAAGIGALTAAVTIGANAGVPPDKAGLAAALLNAAQQVGGALGLAVFSAIASARTSHLLATRAAMPEALTAGFGRALLVASIFVLAAAVTGARARPVSRSR